MVWYDVILEDNRDDRYEFGNIDRYTDSVFTEP